MSSRNISWHARPSLPFFFFFSFRCQQPSSDWTNNSANQRSVPETAALLPRCASSRSDEKRNSSSVRTRGQLEDTASGTSACLYVAKHYFSFAAINLSRYALSLALRCAVPPDMPQIDHAHLKTGRKCDSKKRSERKKKLFFLCSWTKNLIWWISQMGTMTSRRKSFWFFLHGDA